MDDPFVGKIDSFPPTILLGLCRIHGPVEAVRCMSECWQLDKQRIPTTKITKTKKREKNEAVSRIARPQKIIWPIAVSKKLKTKS